jgi:anti-sigma regulatory factor (Ser/Thr protein kinase)
VRPAPAVWLSTTVQAASASFPPVPASVGAARRHVVRALAGSTVGHLQDDVRTVVSELATNAVLHARTPFTLSVHVDVAGVRVAVTDASPARPRLPRRGDLSDTTGRGLRIVAELSADWGVDVHDDGKTTWCVVPTTTASCGRPRDDEGDGVPAPFIEVEADTRLTRPEGRAGGASPAARGAGPEQRAAAA